MKDTIGFSGRFEITITDTKTGHSRLLIIENMLTNLNMMAHLNMLAGQTSGMTLNDLEIKYLAVGSNGTPESPDQTQLFNETFRTPFLTKTITGSFTLSSIFRMNTGDGNGPVLEMGIFGGPLATSAPNSGNMISRITMNEVKSENKIWDINRVDAVTSNTKLDWVK